MKKNIVIVLLSIIMIGSGFYIYHLTKELKEKNELINIEKVEKGKTTVIYNDSEISKLKKENKELYDSIKAYKDEVAYLIQFKYKKTYITDTIYIRENDFNAEIKEFSYENPKTDSLNYQLIIGSIIEPNWYKLKVDVNDKFTIINKKIGETNQTTITTDNSAYVNDITIVNKKTNNFLKRFSVGPTVNAGYSIFNRNLDINIGIGVTYNILSN